MYRLTDGEAAIRGAIAGLAAGGVLLLADRAGDYLERRGVIPGYRTVAGEWDRLVKDAAKRSRRPMTKRQRAAAGIAAHLTYTTLVGAGYGIARNRMRRDARSELMLESVLMNALTAVLRNAGPSTTRRRRGGARPPAVLGLLAAPLQQVIGGMSAPALFASATRTAVEALSRD